MKKDKLELVRDLVFGEQIQIYDKSLNIINQKISDLENEFKQKLSNEVSKFEEKFKLMNKDLNLKFKKLEEELINQTKEFNQTNEDQKKYNKNFFISKAEIALFFSTAGQYFDSESSELESKKLKPQIKSRVSEKNKELDII